MQNEENTKPSEAEQVNIEPSVTDNSAEINNLTDESAASSDKQTKQNTNDLETKVNELNDKYLRLYSEFDNYRRRTVKERSELIKTASEDVLKSILPIIDDFERAIKANENADDISAIKEGVQLIYNKLKNMSAQKGLVAFESIGEVFNPDLMEAITHVPAANEEQKGKVIDDVEKGYKLGEKVIRFAKVVVAQ